jgi:hypothetical protein
VSLKAVLADETPMAEPEQALFTNKSMFFTGYSHLTHNNPHSHLPTPAVTPMVWAKTFCGKNL